MQVPQADFQRTDGLEQAFLKAPADAHHFAGRFHLGAERIVRVGEFVEREARHLGHHIIQGRFKRGRRVCELDLVQRHPDPDFGGNAGDRVAARFGSQRRRAGNAGVDLDEVILERMRVERKLDVAAALDFQRADDFQCAVAQHMVFAVGQSLRGADNDRVAGVNADRVEIFHIADGDGGVVGVAHHLVFDFLIPLDALFNEDLMHRRQLERVFQHRAAGRFVLGKAAAGAAQRESRTQHDGIADLPRDAQPVLDCVRDVRGQHRLAERFAQLFELLAVLRALDAAAFCTQQLGPALGEYALFFKLHRQIQSRLSADARQNGVRPFVADDFGDIFQRQRLHIHLVGDGGVRHNRGRIGVAEDDLVALLLQRQTRLRARVVELRSLSDDDWSGPGDKDLFDVRSLRHCPFPPPSDG